MNQINNPFSNMLSSFDTKRFFGRDLDINPIIRGISSRDPRSFAIHGVKTIGKTSLLKYLFDPQGASEKFTSSFLDYSPYHTKKLEFVYIDFYSMAGDNILHVLYQSLTKSERDQVDLGLTPKVEMGTDKPEIKSALRDALQDYKNRGVRLAICIDHFDKAFESMDYDDDIFLRNLTQYQSFIIVTEKRLSDLRKDTRRTSPLIGVLRPRDIGLLTEAEAKELIEVPAKDAGDPFTSTEIKFILDMAGRQPYLLTVVCEFLFNLRIQYPEVRELLSTDKRVGQQVTLQAESLPAVVELFLLFGDQLNECEEDTLFKIATDEKIDMEREQPALNAMRQKTLIYENLQEGKYDIFSTLFRNYIRRRHQGLPKDGIEEVLGSLAPLDRKLFEYLVTRPNQTCVSRELLKEVWGDANASKRGLDAAIHRIRARLQIVENADWEYIQNVRGKGYQYVPKPT